MNCAVVIPCSNEARHIAGVVGGVLPVLKDVIVVDDGSADGTGREARMAGAEVVGHERNEGKGAAVQTGLRRAMERGFEWAVLMDGDGQHAAEDIPAFLEVSIHPSQCYGGRAARLVVGNRMGNPSSLALLRRVDARGMPWLRRWVNRWMSARLSRRLGAELPDTQCGFRLVHLPSWAKLKIETRHFEIESEMLAAFIEAGHLVRFVPIQVIYKNEASKIDPLIDTLRWLSWWRARDPDLIGKLQPDPVGVHASACAAAAQDIHPSSVALLRRVDAR